MVTKNLPQVVNLREGQAVALLWARGPLDRPDLSQILLDSIHKAFGIVHNLGSVLCDKRCGLQIVILLLTGFSRLDIEPTELGFDDSRLDQEFAKC
jgi:hypothetical protein